MRQSGPRAPANEGIRTVGSGLTKQMLSKPDNELGKDLLRTRSLLSWVGLKSCKRPFDSLERSCSTVRAIRFAATSLNGDSRIQSWIQIRKNVDLYLSDCESSVRIWRFLAVTREVLCSLSFQNGRTKKFMVFADSTLCGKQRRHLIIIIFSIITLFRFQFCN